jgi:hypothetical protein
MNSVYGPLEVGEAPEMPDFLKQMPALVGLENSGEIPVTQA